MSNTIQIKRTQTSAAPSSLNFGELAYKEDTQSLYIGKHDNSVEAVGGAGQFAALASPAFTGNPTAPTQSAGNNSTRLATTAFVAAALAAFTGASGITTVGTITSGTWNGGTIDVAHGGTGATTLTGLVKGNGTSAFSAATAGTDYLDPSSTIDGGTF